MLKRNIIYICMTMLMLLSFTGCGTPEKNTEQPVSEQENVLNQAEEISVIENETKQEQRDEKETDSKSMEVNTEMKVKVQVGNHNFVATLEENEATDAFIEMMKKESVVIQMSDYSGFEKVGPLGQRLPAYDKQTNTQAGDIVLYSGNQIVMFYGSHSWNYTRLGKIEDLSGWEEALGNGDVIVTFQLEE